VITIFWKSKIHAMNPKKLLFLLLFFSAFAGAAFGQARIQVIHNSADLAATTVDVWLDNTLLIDDFAFRNASPFIDAPAGVSFEVRIQPSTSTDTVSPLFRKTFNLTNGETYVVVANGIVSGAGYNPAPSFDLFVSPIGREAAFSSGNTDILVFHGATDAPIVDIVEVGAGAGTIVNDLAYSGFAGYLELATADYAIQVRNQSGNTPLLEYSAPLATLGLTDSALVVVASGFLDPSANSNGEGFGLFAALPSGGALVQLPSQSLSTARVQVIHNSADNAAGVVDVWLNDMLLLDNFAFRTASPFIDAPAGQAFDVSIAPANSVDTTSAIAKYTYTLNGGEKYVLIANGIVSPSGYNPSIPFNIEVFSGAREEATMPSNTDLLVFHGSTDAPVVDVVEVGAGAGTIVDDLAYSGFEGYLELATADYAVQIRNESGNTPLLEFSAPLATLGLSNASLVVVASGFLDPSQNSNGEGFGLFAALPSGGALVQLPSLTLSTARVQVIHNSADAAAATVDIWLNDGLLLDDFSFRTASPFIDAPAGQAFDISIAPANSTDTTSAIAKYSYTLDGGEKYILVANGIVSPSGYNPAIPFNIEVFAGAREEASQMGNTDVLVFHGSTDAPVVDVFETGIGAGLIVDDLAYTDFDGYLELGTLDYALQIRNQAGNTPLLEYSAPLATLGLDNSAISVLASGFLDPSANSNGAGFGLYAALPSGGSLVPLPSVALSTARVQAIHNSADLAAGTVDVWLNDMLLLDDFAYLTASPFIDAPAGQAFDLSIAPANSVDTTSAIAKFTYTLDGGEKYLIVANGIVSGSGYNPVQPFDLYVYAGAREEATMAGNTDVLVFHGATDAPVVDVVETSVPAGTVVDDLAYGDFQGYLELGTLDYTLEVRDEFGISTLAGYSAPLATLGLDNSAITVLASGFLMTAQNSNGNPFGLYAALPSGGNLIPLPTVTTGIEDVLDPAALMIFPNPASEEINIRLESLKDAGFQVAIMDLAGNLVRNSDFGRVGAGINEFQMDLSGLSGGMYMLKLETGSGFIVQKLVIR
jgi:hypothetical protein